MERYNLGYLTKQIYHSHLSFFNLQDLRSILAIKRSSTLFAILRKLQQAGVLEKIERGKYYLSNAEINDFATANFLYQPSYVSFESALNFYNILSQFPYEISSATPRKTARKEFRGKVFTYATLNKNLFWGYEKKDDFLIALPEKALLDQLYFAAKGRKPLNLEEYDLQIISRPRFKNYLSKYNRSRQFESILEKAKPYLKI